MCQSLRTGCSVSLSSSRSSALRQRIETCNPYITPRARRQRWFARPPAAQSEEWPPSSTRSPPPPPLSSRVRVVLVSPRTSANVGAACRASSNFGVDDLFVVAPRCDPRDDEASKLSRGVSSFQKFRVAADLAEALEGTAAAVGISRRARRAYEGVRELLGAGIPGVSFVTRRKREKKEEQSSLPLALVFGREESGLTAAELAKCSASLALRTSSDAPSMNLSAAVAVTLALLQEEAARVDDDDDEDEGGEEEGDEEGRERSSSSSAPTVSTGTPPLPSEIAPPSAIDALVLRVAELAVSLELEAEPRETAGGGGAHGRKPRLAGHARALLTRARASGGEVGAMHALLRAAEQRLLEQSCKK